MREVLGDLLQRHVKDPRVGFVTITRVQVNPDLSRAHVYYTVLGDREAQAQTHEGLESASSFLRTEVGRQIRLKTLPELVFRPDDSVEHGRRVDRLLEHIHQVEGVKPATRLPPLPAPVDEALDAAADLLEDAERVAVACHIGPDGDALGSILALGIALRALGKDVVCGWGSEDVEVPAQYAFLPGQELLVPPDRFVVREAAVAIDCASADRLELLRDRMEGSAALVQIDHHLSNTLFGKTNVVDDAAPASADLVLRLLERLEVEVTPEIATCLYTGLVTDTGRFSYANATPRAHHAAAYLIEHGVRVDEIAQAVYESLPFGYLRILGRALERCRLLDDPPLIVSYLTQADLKESGVALDETEDVINVLRSTRDTDAAAVLKELDDGTWKGSLRSKGAGDVSAVARAFGGGGHQLAAGFTSEDGLEDTISKIHAQLAAAYGEPEETSSP